VCDVHYRGECVHADAEMERRSALELDLGRIEPTYVLSESLSLIVNGW
jgi:hypothetical protein